uniref:Secreted protein n=1 Tax=Physcomitrium patens TaxID=3218 RepID=A0A2K1L151_PHYPA|nr:hypothetical protein PHYPA_002533 [Physcomitrium patens]
MDWEMRYCIIPLASTWCLLRCGIHRVAASVETQSGIYNRGTIFCDRRTLFTVACLMEEY